MKLLYKPLGLLVSVLGGILASAVFNTVWTAATGQEEAPEPPRASSATRRLWGRPRSKVRSSGR